MIAALYDIHGNLPALEAVLADVVRMPVETLVVGGDVFPGPFASEALQQLLTLDLPVRFIHGNGDRETLSMRRHGTAGVPEAYRDVMEWSASCLTPQQEEVIASWAPRLRVTSPTLGTVLFCHATPRNDTDVFTRDTPEDRLLPIFRAAGAELVVCGHTHMQFDRSVGTTRVVNAGSVGMPFGERGAYWLLLGRTVELRRTDYDFEAAAARVRRSGYPHAEQFAAANILNPPSEEQMLALFSRAELGS